MKKIITSVFLFFGLVFSSFVLADSTITMKGPGSRVKVVDHFSEAVAIMGGMVTSQNAFSALGEFKPSPSREGDYIAKLYVKEDKGIVDIRIAVNLILEENKNLFSGLSILSKRKKEEKEIVDGIIENMNKLAK